MSLEERAKELSRDFIENEGQYRLGFIEAEGSHPATRDLGATFVRSTEDGIRMLIDVDRDLVGLYGETLESSEFADFYRDVLTTLVNRKRIFISGCGSSGRLSMRLEASFREALREIGDGGLIRDLGESVHEIMTGGDYAIIRAVESFEDYTELGCLQARDAGVSEGDLLIGVTATGETTSVLGTAKEALSLGAKVWMVVCSDPEDMLGKLSRVDDVYTHKNARSLYLKCGPMALTGSTRMQSSSIEQAIIGSALECALGEIYNDVPMQDRIGDLKDGFAELISLLGSKRCIASMAKQTDLEAELYSRGGYVTYFADGYILDVLADTTERGPTFTTPPFRPQSRVGETLSWSFVKNPFLNTVGAWEALFGRTPRCVSKTREEYLSVGISDSDIKRIPNISLDALYEFEIGCEPDPEREGDNTLATWIDFSALPPRELDAVGERYGARSALVLGEPLVHSTRMKLFEHLAVKMAINAVSTGAMAKMGRVLGNYMVHLNISNKKLVDRATRIIADLCKVDYERANYELFLSKLILDGRSIERSTTVETVERLGIK